MDGQHGSGQEGVSTGVRRAREATAIARDHRKPEIDDRMARVETRLAFVGVSLAYLEGCRRYIQVRLADAAEDVAYAGDTGLAFEEVRRLYANDHWASFGDAGLLAQVDAALVDIGARLAEIDAQLAQISSNPVYTEAGVALSNIEAALVDIEVGLARIGATLAHVDALLWNVGAGRQAPDLLRRIPLPSVTSGYASVAGQRRG